jgi:hypothetical protein
MLMPAIKKSCLASGYTEPCLYVEPGGVPVCLVMLFASASVGWTRRLGRGCYIQNKCYISFSDLHLLYLVAISVADPA